ncbi:MAG: hypothetical protein ACK55I_19795 [bacterium]
MGILAVHACRPDPPDPRRLVAAGRSCPRAVSQGRARLLRRGARLPVVGPALRHDRRR